MKIVKKNKTYFFNFNDETEAKELDNYTNKELEIKTITDNVVSLVVKTNVSQSEQSKNTLIVGQQPSSPPAPMTKPAEIKAKITRLLQDKDFPFQDKVEGKFETLLKPEDLLIFKEMLKTKEIITYKQSEKYKKAIYVVNEGKQIAPVSLPATKSTTIQENADTIIKEFFKKKYAIIKTLEAADKFSREYYSKFKNNEIKGQKSFDGHFYVIDVFLYNTIRKQILSCNLDKNFSIEDLSKKLNKDTELLKIAIEFLKEEGVIIEKRKNIYCLV